MTQRAKQDVATWQRRRAARPQDPDSAAGLARALIHANRAPEAATLLAPLCQTHPALLRLLAQALLRAGQPGPAAGALFMADAHTPNDPATQAELADALLSDRNAEAARPYAQAAFHAHPSAGNAATLSCILIHLGLEPEALAVTTAALARHRRDATLWTNHSIALEGLGRMDDAIAAARQALAAAPNSAFAQHHVAGTLLVDGQLGPEAWRLYEGRLGLHGVKPIPTARRWTGAPMPGKTILLHAEQGLGDTLQFVRYVPLVAAASGARIILAVQPGLVRLLHDTPGADAVISATAPLPPFDAVAPLLSLPGIFATTLDTIPPPIPYAAFPPTPRKPNQPHQVGIAWAGSPGFVADTQRSLPEHHLQTLIHLADLTLPGVTRPGIVFHGLQLGAGDRPGIPDRTAAVRDMADTAALIAPLDLVITVDTAIAHLAATLGKPTWLLSRHRGCWRWLRHRQDSPWYPTMSIFRQPRPNDWTPVIQTIQTALRTPRKC